MNISAPAATIDGDVQTLEPHESREGERFEGGDLTDVDLSGISLMDCILRGGKIDLLNLRGAKLTDVLIEDAQITELDLCGFTGTLVAIRNCRIE